MAKRAVIYVRVSTSNQNVESQLLQLREAAKIQNVKVIAEIADQGISGTKSRKEREGFDRLHKMMEAKKVDVILCWSIDRISRSMLDLAQFLETVQANNVDLYCHQQSISTNSTAGRLIFNIFSSLASWEREMITERVRMGIERAKKNGVKLGRPTNVTEDTKDQVLALRRQGISIGQIAKRLKIGVGTTVNMINAGG